MRFPTEETSIVCLCNLAEATPSAYSNAVADILLADRFEGVEKESTDEPEEAAEGESPHVEFAHDPAVLPGRYYSYELGFVYEVSVNDTGVNLEVGNDLDGELIYVGDDSFDRDGVTLQFIIENDKATAIRVDGGRARNFLFTRIGAP